MSLDSIVRITITAQNLQMAQAGFGIPLIIAEHELWSERIRSFSDLSELTKKPEKPSDPQPLSTNTALYNMAKALMAQNPKVPNYKIGRRAKGESVVDALNAICEENSDFYGVLLVNDHPEAYASEIEALAESVNQKRLLLGVDVGDEQLSMAALLKDRGFKRIFFIYKANEKDYPAAAWMGKMLPQAPGSASWAFKELSDISKSKLSTSKIGQLTQANVNRYLNIKDVGVTLEGKVAQGEYIDIVHGIDWLHVRIQERLFRLLMLNSKIPYTMKGVDLVRSEIMAQLKEAVYRGLLAADPEPQVSIPDIETIDPAIRASRILPDVRFNGLWPELFIALRSKARLRAKEALLCMHSSNTIRKTIR